MKILCMYCDDKKCNCGGKRKILSQPKDGKSGEVKVECQSCGCTWLHWHQREGRSITGTARPM